MKATFPEYPDNVALYAVGVDPFESLSELEEYRSEQGFPFPVAVPEGRMLVDLRVVQQSTKVAIDASGRIIYRDGYGRDGGDGFREVFLELSESAG